jgi:2-amino-4-hydroxy-6-hydroxymethyldihydropteridine diphosphokinase
MYCQDTLLALGGNLNSPAGSPEETMGAALRALEKDGAVIRDVSRYYHTPAFPEGAGPEFVNAAARIEADWTPEAALAACHRVEAALGRVRKHRWGSRTLDIDLIAMGDRVLPDASAQSRWRALSVEDQQRETPERLILPHPRLQDRAFVLVPLADVAPDWVHPLTGRSVAEMLAALPQPDRDAVRPVAQPWPGRG